MLFAGAAIGNSHLVQSTRAGALFGLGLIVAVLFANIIKYPAFRFGPQYTAATGRSLIAGYRRLGRWAVAVFALSEVAVMAIIIAATAVTTAAVSLAVVGVNAEVRPLAMVVILIGAGVLWFGGYPLLDRMTKVFVAILAMATVASTAIALPTLTWSASAFAPPPFDLATFAFVIALMGFMPATLNLAVLQSLWILAKTQTDGKTPTRRQVMLDFNIGYVGTAALALCFALMGAGVLHADGVAPAQGGAAFAAQVITLYTTNLGAWSGVIIGLSATMVMFTTLVTVLDGFPRALAAAWVALRSQVGDEPPKLDRSPVMHAATLVLVVGALATLQFFLTSFQGFIDFVTITAFLVAPYTAALNHIVMTRPSVPAEHRPGPIMQAWSLFGLVSLTALSLAYFYWSFIAPQ